MKTTQIIGRAWLTAVLLTFGLATTQAQTVWTNTAGGSWNTAANWSPNFIPAEGTNVTTTNFVTTAFTLTYTAPMAASSSAG